jgi:hypothetical protein
MPPKLRLCLNGSHATYYTPTHLLMAGKTLVGWDKSVGIAAGRSGDRILVGMRFSAPTQTGTRAHPAYHTMGTGYFLRVMRLGRGGDHSHPSSYTSTPLWAFVACSR